MEFWEESKPKHFDFPLKTSLTKNRYPFSPSSFLSDWPVSVNNNEKKKRYFNKVYIGQQVIEKYNNDVQEIPSVRHSRNYGETGALLFGTKISGIVLVTNMSYEWLMVAFGNRQPN